MFSGVRSSKKTPLGFMITWPADRTMALTLPAVQTTRPFLGSSLLAEQTSARSLG